MHCLLEVLRRQRVDRVIGEAEWDAAFALAESEHVLPWAAACLRSRRAALAPAVTGRLDQIERDAAIAAFYWGSELKGVLHAFTEREIRAIPLKGPLLAERLYGSTALRVSRDLDVLVAREDLSRAEATLADQGFVPGDADDYHRPWHRASTTVELHQDVENPLAFNFHVASALRRVQPAVFLGERCSQLSPEDELVFLCLHAVRHRYERLSLIVDLQLAFERLPVEATGWHPRPLVGELDSLVGLGLAMARRLQPGLTVASDVHRPGRDAEHLERLADRLWNRLLEQPGDPLDWRTVHAFYVEIEASGWGRISRRRRHLQILLSRVIAPDTAFAARFRLHRKWQARMLRPVRLLCEWVRLRRHSGY